MLQETKAGDKDIPGEVKNVSGYHTFWQSTENKGGYAGVGLFSKEKPVNVTFGMGESILGVLSGWVSGIPEIFSRCLSRVVIMGHRGRIPLCSVMVIVTLLS